MRLGRNSQMLDGLWDSSSDMKDWDLYNFDGMYRVEMATGIIPNLPNWRKYIGNTGDMLRIDDSQVSGYNCYFRSGVFGQFGVRIYHYSLPHSGDLYTGLLLEYDNGLFKDYIRLIRPHLFLGRFYVVLRDREIFMGYFWLYATEPYRKAKPPIFGGLTSDVESVVDGTKGISFLDLGTRTEIKMESIRSEIHHKTMAEDLAIIEEEVEKTTKPDTKSDDKEKDDLGDGWVEE